MHQIFGIRHHGPGSARSLLSALTALQPDIVLVEGPPDANDLLPLLAHEQMQPPVALLVYAEDEPHRSAFYPFAEFSPETQAIRFALSAGVAVRFIDLPMAHQLVPPEELAEDAQPHLSTHSPAPDPFAMIAQAAGYADGERWWEHLVEQRGGASEVFAAIRDIMGELRQEVDANQIPTRAVELNAKREAHMRQSIRQAQKEGFARIAVVCGAWHAPALEELSDAKEDVALLKGLPKVKVAATWTPWTQGRLTYASGYGAGVASPGWYTHLWQMSGQAATARQTVINWMTKVAHLLREKDLDASSASVIEAVRLAETLAAFRGRALPDLPDMNEACRTIFCFGDDLPMKLISERLIVGERIGSVPESAPATPLQRDLSAEQRRLRLSPEALSKQIDLDLRKPTDLERSHLLHRLNLLGISWGTMQGSSGKGTFRELWQITWQPEFAVRIVEASVWGNTVRDAAVAFTRAAAQGIDVSGATTDQPTLAVLTRLLDIALVADLPDAVETIMTHLQERAAIAADVAQLMDALPPLANVSRYGNVRQTDVGAVRHVAEGFVARICVGLAPACASLNDDAANEMLPRLGATHTAIDLLQEEEWRSLWKETLLKLIDLNSLHGLLAGRCCRILLDQNQLSSDECARRMGLALSTASDPGQAAGWVAGLLGGSGLLLVHDERLWQVVDAWVSGIHSDVFIQVLPLLRRTFSQFSSPERRQMGERVRAGNIRRATGIPEQDSEFDQARAEQVLPILAQILGLTMPQLSTSEVTK